MTSPASPTVRLIPEPEIRAVLDGVVADYKSTCRALAALTARPSPAAHAAVSRTAYHATLAAYEDVGNRLAEALGVPTPDWGAIYDGECAQ